MELHMDLDIEGFQNTSSVVFSNSQSNVFPSFPSNPNSISNKVSSISLDAKRKRQDIDIVVTKSARMDTEVTVNCNGGPYLVLSSNHNKDGRYFHSNV